MPNCGRAVLCRLASADAKTQPGSSVQFGIRGCQTCAPLAAIFRVNVVAYLRFIVSSRRLNGVPCCESCYKACSCLGNDTFRKIKDSVSENTFFQHCRKGYFSRFRIGFQKVVVEAILELCNLVADEMPHVTVTHPDKRRHKKRPKPGAVPVELTSLDSLEVDPTELESREVDTNENDPEEEPGDLEEDHVEEANLFAYLSEELGKDVRNLVKIPAALYNGKRDVYEEFLKRGRLPMTIKYKTFVRYWLKYLWHVIISEWQPFAKCDVCIAFRTALLNETDKVKLEELKSKQEVHRQQVTLARKRLHARECLAKFYPQYFLTVYADGMDIKKSNIPRTRALLTSKSVESSGQPLDTKLLGVQSIGRGFHGFWSYPHFAANNNVTLTCMLEYFAFVVKEEGRLPPFLYIQFDNSGKDNKSVYLLAFVGYLLLLGLTKQVEVHFLPVGHTHSRIDQAFSCINRKLGAEDLLTLDHLIQKVKYLFVSSSCYSAQHTLLSVVDFTKCFNGLVKEFGGHGTVRVGGNKRRLHAFKFVMEGSVPAVLVKEHDESGSLWRGDWKTNKALPIFETLPPLQLELDLAPRRPVKNLEAVRSLVDEVHQIVLGEPLVVETSTYVPTLKWGKVTSNDVGKEDDTDGSVANKLQAKRKEFQSISPFWQWYFLNDKAFWESPLRDKDNPDSCREANAGMFAFPTFSPLYRSSTVSRTEPVQDVNSEALSLSQVLESCSVEAVLSSLPNKVPSVLRKALEETILFETKSRVKENRDDSVIFLYHKSDKPPARCSFNPEVDCLIKQAALLQVGEGSTNNRGWELAIVKSISKSSSGAKVMDVWYLEPVPPENKDRSACWEGNWWERRLTHVKLPVGTSGRTLLWADWERKVEDVMYSFFLTNAKKIPKKLFEVITSQIKRIENKLSGTYQVDELAEEDEVDED